MKKVINNNFLILLVSFSLISYWGCSEDDMAQNSNNNNDTINQDTITKKDTIDDKDSIPDEDRIKLSKAEKELYDIMMEYRSELNLKPIPLSLSMTKVAQIHSKDLFENRPHGGDCNMHSWSDKGDWTSCCYTSDHAQAACMWNKPKELTNYEGNGFEIAAGSSSSSITPQLALSLWKNSPGHNTVIINSANWTREWKAIGLGIVGGYATVWFGREEDPDGEPDY
jgi:uncharacterized protein YkwD